MATKSDFSRTWQGFVDHKWSKKRLCTFLVVQSSQTHYEEVRVRERLFPKLPQRYRPLGGNRKCKNPDVSVICSGISRLRWLATTPTSESHILSLNEASERLTAKSRSVP